MAKKIVLIALEGTLLNSFEHEDERVEALTQSLSQLQEGCVPVVLFTGCDRAEVEPIRKQLGLTAPFVVESGSAIFASLDDHPFEAAMGEKDDGYFVVTLGCPYVQARAGLRVIANEISHPLKGFGDFTVPQLEKAAKLSESAAHKAKAREFSEPFMTPKAVDPAALCRAADEMGFSVILRPESESRFSELIGADAGLDKAFRTLVSAYRSGLAAGDFLEVVLVSHRAEDFATLSEVCRLSTGVEMTKRAVDELTVDGLISAVKSLA